MTAVVVGPRPRTVIALANEMVSILAACRLVGMDLPDDVGHRRSIKVHCPFGSLYHSDHGLEQALRIYTDSNSAWCFAGCGYFSPVWLVAQAWDLSATAAATELLDRIGYRPPTLEQAWARASQVDDTPDVAALRTALQTYCERIAPAWAERQFEAGVAATLTRCLALLDLVTSGAEAQTWLAAAKTVMRRTLVFPSDTVAR